MKYPFKIVSVRPYQLMCLVCRSGDGTLRQKKDLDVLQRLGLKFGDVLPARRLYRLLFDRIVSTRQICGYDDGITRGDDWKICRGDSAEEGSAEYQKGRTAGLGIKGL